MGGENFDFDCLVEVQRFGAADTFLHFFPKWGEHMASAGRAYDEFLSYFDVYYDRIRSLKDQRELAQEVKQLKLPHKVWPAALFEMKKEDVRSAREFFAFVTRARFLKLWKSYHDHAKRSAGQKM